VRLVTILGYTVFMFNQAVQANSGWPSLHEDWRWLWPPPGKDGKLCVTVGSVTRTAGVLT